MTQTDIEVQLKDHDNEIGSLKHRMTRAEENIDAIKDLTISVKLMAQKQDTLADNINKLSDSVKKLEDEPRDTWAKIKTTILTSCITAVVTAAIAAIIALT